METKFNGMIPPPSSPPIYTELMWLAIFLICVAVLVWRHRSRSELSNSALIFIGAGSMFWQEYYNNWGGYLLYSPDLHLWPWGSTWWTAPNKPMFILVSYAPFFMLIYSALTFLNRKIKQALPAVPMLAISLAVNAPLFWLWNYAIDKSSVESGVWNYVVTWGPTQVTANGGYEPLVWPMIPFGIYGALIAYYLMKHDANGHPTFLGLGRPERHAPGVKRELVRAVTSMAWWNAMYWFGFTMWINLIRDLFLPASTLVP